MEKNEAILDVNAIIVHNHVNHKKLKELLEAARENSEDFSIRYGLEKAIEDIQSLLSHLWTVLGEEIGYDLRNLVKAIDEEEAAKKEQEDGDGE